MNNSRAIGRAVALLSLALSCSGNRNDRGHVCDGSKGLRLAMARLSNPERFQAGQQVMFENGSVYLFVDGSCRYWAQADVWAGTRSGVLSPSQASQLEADVHYAEWSRGGWEPPTVYDDSFDVLFDTSVKLSCSSLCAFSSAPAYLKDVSAQFEDLAGALWNAGTPVEGVGVRIKVARLDPGTYGFVPHASWPLSLRLQDISEDQGVLQQQGYGHGILFQGEDAAQLRALRAIYQGGSYRRLGVPGLPLEGEQGHVDLLFVRDVLQFEDASGLVRPDF